jgi:hypothetical protein
VSVPCTFRLGAPNLLIVLIGKAEASASSILLSHLCLQAIISAFNTYPIVQRQIILLDEYAIHKVVKNSSNSRYNHS